MALRDRLKKLIRLVHDPVDLPPQPQPGAAVRREIARAESDLGRQHGGSFS